MRKRLLKHICRQNVRNAQIAFVNIILQHFGAEKNFLLPFPMTKREGKFMVRTFN
jgi:hypothetical protein